MGISTFYFSSSLEITAKSMAMQGGYLKSNAKQEQGQKQRELLKVTQKSKNGTPSSQKYSTRSNFHQSHIT